ncbi:hypothetical protein ODV19_03870 [Lactobacillus amylovorus]|nr:hypothetical protein [Lactobacillus amylovorus]MCH4139804.1 hypothetical protein [Lactobacillus amylovorus]MDA6089150.1 hypothetical protein [Lactobacillus amylovorus]
MGWLSTKSGAYQILYAIGDTLTYPTMVQLAASKTVLGWNTICFKY